VRISLNDDYTTNWVSSKMLVPLLLRWLSSIIRPTGKMLTQSDFEALESLLQKYQKLLSSLMKYMSISLWRKAHISIHALNY
jgi:methionine aminotransferase